MTQFHSPRGRTVQFLTRPGTSDGALAGAHLAGDEYRLREVQVEGVALDVGALTGAVSFSLLADNPNLRVIALEPLAENCDMIAQTAAANGWSDRIEVLCGAIGDGTTVDIPHGYLGSSYAEDNRYVGGLKEQTATLEHEVVTVPAVTISQLVERAGGEVALMVIDCEGAEWVAFADPALTKIERIIGEFHDAPPERLQEALEGDYELIVEEAGAGSEIGLFWALRR